MYVFILCTQSTEYKYLSNMPFYTFGTCMLNGQLIVYFSWLTEISVSNFVARGENKHMKELHWKEAFDM